MDALQVEGALAEGELGGGVEVRHQVLDLEALRADGARFGARRVDGPLVGGDALGLSLADIDPLVFRHKRQYLQHDIA